MDSFIPLLITSTAALLSLAMIVFAVYVHLSPATVPLRYPARALLVAAGLGALAPTLWFEGREILASLSLPDRSRLAWLTLMEFFRSLGIAGLALMLAYRRGLRQPIALWLLAALCALPLGFVMAHPADFRFSPTEEDFVHGPYWRDMVIYMALFGLSGFAYGRLLETREASVLQAAKAGRDWLGHAHDGLLTNRRFLLRLIGVAPEAFQHLPSWVKSDAELSELAVRGFPGNLRYLPVDFAADQGAALAMLRRHPHVFEFMPEQVRADRSCALAALTLCPANLRHVSAELRSDKAVVIDAINAESFLNTRSESCLSVEFAAPELRQDPDVLEAARRSAQFKAASHEAYNNR
jgi:hypothetical protein